MQVSSSIPPTPYQKLKYFEIVFDKTGSTALVLDSSTAVSGKGYRVSVWAFDNSQCRGFLSHEDLDSDS